MDSEMNDLLEKAMADKLRSLESQTPDEQRTSIDEVVKLNSVMLARMKHDEEERREIQAQLDSYGEETESEFRRRQFEAEQQLKQAQFEADPAFREKQLQIEAENQKAQIREQRKDRLLKIGLTLAELGFIGWSVLTSFKFEETGTVTSQTGRKILGWISPKRK